ncbi:MAG: CopD family protein [Pseudomonadales bacterium]
MLVFVLIMLWLKTFHLLFVMAWMAGIFYMPRILVHYAEGKDAGEDVRRLVIMEAKLLRFSTIMAVIALGLGIWLWLVYWPGAGAWLLLKLLLVLVLIGYHIQCYRYLNKMIAGQPIPSGLFLRFFNEFALIIVVPILILVIVKPF